MKNIQKLLVLGFILVYIYQAWAEKKPNFIIIFTDDQGYADLSCYGGDHVSTPHIDQMAAEGVRCTNFYVAAPVCTPSRAALMTGCYPNRISMERGSDFGVLLADDPKGLNLEEVTIAEMLKSVGYKTALFGKWHLGDQLEFLPTRQGFDEFFGIPYSHDIHPHHPNQKRFQFPPLPLYEGEKVIEYDPDADYLTKRLTDRAVKFIKEHKDEPFFVYLPHPLPHKPLHVSPKYMKGVDKKIINELNKEDGNVDYDTRNKLFRQVMHEIDDSVHSIIETLKECEIDHNTIILYSTDNGPAVGKAMPLKGRKGSVYEGGMRVPGIVYAPGYLKPSVNHELMTTMDMLPTFSTLAGAKLNTDKEIDGKDVWPTLKGEAKTPHQVFFYKETAMRSGDWKAHFKKGKASELYNLKDDIGERKNVLAKHPEKASELEKLFKAHHKRIDEQVRPAGWLK